MKEGLKILSTDDGIFLLNTIGNFILSYIKEKRWIERPKHSPKGLEIKRGVFVSIIEKIKDKKETTEKYVFSIGNPHPSIPLIDTALNAATKIAIDLSFNSSIISRARAIKKEELLNTLRYHSTKNIVWILYRYARA